MKATVIGLAVLLLAACDASSDGSKALAEAKDSGEAAGAAVQATVQQSNATPLEKEQALALMKERHENYEKIGAAMKGISRELKGEDPNLGKVQAGAATIAALAPKVPSWFPAGTGPDVGKTEARAEIWQKPEDFAAKAQEFRLAAVTLEGAAKGSDLASIRSAHANLGKSCKGCHDLYREEE